MKLFQILVSCSTALPLFLGFNSQIFAQCSTCYEQTLGVSLSNRASIDICENFNAYNLGTLPTNNLWKPWSSTSNRPSVQSSGNSKFLAMVNSGNFVPDVLLLLGNRNTGRYRLSWELYVTPNRRAVYDLLHNQSGAADPNWAYEVSFETSGMGYLYIADQAEPVKRDSFKFVHGSWNRIMQIIDLDKDRVELWINDEYVSAWDFSRGTRKQKILGAVSFYANANCNYFIDNICLWRALPCQAFQNYAPVCVKSGMQYDNSSLAGCDLYTSREFKTGECNNETVCNYGAKFIEIEGPQALGRLESGALPESLVNEACIRNVFGNKAPGELYGEIFVFQFDPAKYLEGRTVGIYWNTKVGKSRAFVFKCNCNDPSSNLCDQDCVLPKSYVPPSRPSEDHLIANIPFDQDQRTFYYVVLLSDTPTDFTLSISPCVFVLINGNQDVITKSTISDEDCTLCLTNTPILLTCNTPLNGNLRNQGSEFSTDGSVVYNNCARSSRKYEGEDLVHKFTLTVPSKITLTLNGLSTPMGMFLYNQYCGQNCLATTENSASGGTASIGPVDLDPGDYYVIVDKDSPIAAGNTNYVLTLNCNEDQNPEYLYDESICPTVTTNPHTVRIQAINALLMDNLTLTLKDKINFVYDKGQGNYVLENGKYWNAQGLTFQFYADQAGDGIKCGYAPNDSFDIRVIKNETIYKVKPLFSSNQNGKFTPGAQSTINGFTKIGLTSTLSVSTNFREVDADLNNPLTQVLVNSDVTWGVLGADSWLNVTRESNSTRSILNINVLSRNPNTTPRNDTLVILGSNKMIRRVVISQKACTAASADLGENLTVCQGERVILRAQGTGNYLWGNGSTGSTFDFTANVVGPTTYQVKSTVSGCTATARVTVNVRPKPLVELGSNLDVCAGTPIRISPQIKGSSGPYFYQWSTGENTSSITPISSAQYILSVTDNNGCVATDEVSVHFKPLPLANAGLDQSICAGQNAILQASGGTSYRWSNDSTSAKISVNPASSANFTVTVTQDGCEAADEVRVTVKPLPLASAGLDQSICAGQSATLRASGGTSYRWSNNSTSAEVSVSPASNTNFTVTVTLDGCEATDEVRVTVKSLPIANAGLDQSICAGQSAILRASGGTSYRWSNNSTSAEISVTPSTSANFMVTVTQDGCEATDEVRVTVKPLPIANAGLDQSICAGQNAILRASGGTSYRWSTNSTSAEINVNPSASANFTVTVTQDGCEATDEVRVTVKPLPIANAGLDQSICAGQNAILRASGGTSYRWSTNSTSAEINVNPSASANFTVTVTLDGCEATDEVRVNVKPLPLANAGLDQSICAGQNAILRASGGTSYRWSNNSTSAEVSVNPAASVNFTVTVTLDGCEATDEVRVTVKPLPIANAGLDQSICAGQSAILRVSGGTSYRWSNNSTSAEVSVNPAASVNFTVTVTLDGCEATDEVRVNVKPLPLANAGLDQSICVGQNAILRANGGTSYRWSNNSTSAEINVNPSASANFTVTVTQDGCEATDEVRVTVKSLPIANAGLDQSICAGQNAILRASGGTSYRWSTNSTSAEINVNPSASANFTVTVTQDGCEATDEVRVTVKPLPIANAGLDQSICAGQNAILRASGGTSYRWSNNSTSAEVSVNPSASANFTVTVTRDGCEATDEVRVTVKSLPIANAGLDQSICAGQSAILRASGGTSYRWSNNNTSAEINVNPSASVNFTVTVTQDGCEATDEVRVTVKPLPIANAGLDQSICAGQNAILRASGGTSYRWSNNSTSAEVSVNPSASVNFTVTVTQDGCEATDEVRVTVKPLPIANAGLDQSICAGQNAILRASGGTSYRWSNNSTSVEISVNPAASVNFTVTVTQDGCEATDEVRVNVKPLPLANAGLDQSICAGQNAILRASGGTSYRWSNNSTSAEISVNPAASANFTVTVTQDGCEASDRVEIKVNPNPSVMKESIHPAAGENGNIQVKVIGGTPGYQYQWFRNDTLISTQEDLIGLKTGIFKLIVTDANGCIAVYGPELITKSRELTQAEGIRIFPNPNTGRFKVQFQLEQNAPIEINILDALGRKVIWNQARKILKNETFEVDISQHTAGVYWIQFKIGNQSFYQKIIRQ